jgi:hypothetical protein
MEPTYLDQIYLDKCSDENPSFNWVYYRLTSVDVLGNPAGRGGSTVQICRVKWPSLGDKGTPRDTPGQGDLTSAFSVTNRVLAEWGVDHENRGVLIGLRERAANLDQPQAAPPGPSRQPDATPYRQEPLPVRPLTRNISWRLPDLRDLHAPFPY